MPEPDPGPRLPAPFADKIVEVDVIVYTPREILEWGEVDQAFVTTAVREGVVDYERRA